MRINVSKSSREKYSEIKVTWWEAEHFSTNAYLWWLPDSQSFGVGDDEVRIPINSFSDTDADVEESIYYNYISPIRVQQNTNAFPVRGSQSGSKISMICIWGEDDDIIISDTEFSRAGGSVVLDFDPTTQEHEVVITPPQREIGINENFSITLEGSVPALVIAGNGTKFHKRTQSVRTLHYGKVHSVLEVELPYVTNRDMLYNSIQRLLEKYSYDGLQYSVEYRDNKIPQIDNNTVVPQSVSIEGEGGYSTSDGFQFISLNDLSTEKTLDEISDNETPLHIYQRYIRAFIN